MMIIFFIISLMIMFMFKNLKLSMLKIFLQNLCFFMSFLYLFKYLVMFDVSLSLYFGLNLYSYGLILLSLWILGLMILGMPQVKNLKMCLFYLIILLTIIVLTFLTLDMLMFFLFFEMSLIPIFMIIMKWGMSSERVSSGFYLLFYTMFFSLPLMVKLFSVMTILGSMNFFLLNILNVSFGKFYFFIMIMAFLVKIPMFLMHSWLLKAHVEAPVFGSMILAALLLKLGGYGLIRLMYFLNNDFINYNKIFISIGVLGSLLLSLVALIQIDMKILVAYSSVVHMSLMISGMMTMLKIGLMGGYMMMIAHGLCSSAMFMLVNINYERFNSRLLIFNKGLINIVPSLSLWWFLICSSNMAAPPSMNLISEIFMLMSLMIWSSKLLIIMMMVCFFSFLYSLYLFSYINHGLLYNYFSIIMDVKMSEYLTLVMHWLPMNLFFLNMILFIN